MRTLGRAVLMGAAATGAVFGGAQVAAQAKKPRADYWVTAETATGMMSGGRATKTLQLQLGSGGKAPAPQAEHLPPAGLQAGSSLPLLTPRAGPAMQATPGPMGPMQQPKGRMLIYWGCGEHVGPGQPVTVDYASMAGGKAPAIFSQQLVTPQNPPSSSTHATYGEWPNEQTSTTVPAGGSLVGEHTVRGNYSPQINFTLDEDQDFLAPLTLSGNDPTPSGAVRVAWNAVPGALAYGAMVMGSKPDQTMVMWSSSEAQAMPFALMGHLSESDVSKLLGRKVLMPPSQTQCVVPQEVTQAVSEGGMLMMAAYGREANFSYPPKPSDPKLARAWSPEWTTKVRFKSTTSGMLGMQMPDMAGGDDGDDGQAEAEARARANARNRGRQPRQPSTTESVIRGLGDFIRR